MRRKTQFDYWQRVGRHIRPGHFFAWFLGINLPIAFALSAFTGWHNNLVGQPGPVHLLMRASIAVGAFGAGMIVFWHKVVKPAIRAEKEEGRRGPDEP